MVLGVYDVAGWMRQLLLDATPLSDVVSRKSRLRVKFVVNTMPLDVLAAIRDGHGVLHPGAGLSTLIAAYDAGHFVFRDSPGLAIEAVRTVLDVRGTRKTLFLMAAPESAPYDKRLQQTTGQPCALFARSIPYGCD
ncbi:MAG: hypothetical protein SFU57_02570 [Gemmatimonadales bacterium]|nr:hypothetical protein [Gemmatimonadales bacterium]